MASLIQTKLLSGVTLHKLDSEKKKKSPANHLFLKSTHSSPRQTSMIENQKRPKTILQSHSVAHLNPVNKNTISSPPSMKIPLKRQHLQEPSNVYQNAN